VVGKIKITQLIGTINIDLMGEVLIFGLILLCCKSMIKHTHIWAEDRGKELMVGTVQYIDAPLIKGKQKLMTKELLSKDGDMSGNLGKPPDDATKLASPLSHCKSGVMTQKNLNVTKMTMMHQKSDKPWMQSQKARAKSQLGMKRPKKSHQMWTLMHSTYLHHVMSGSDPRGTCNADNDGGPSGPRRHGLELVRQSETRMFERMPERTSERSWMARVWMVTRTRAEVQTGSEGTGSDL
jgi:hypothetical protein